MKMELNIDQLAGALCHDKVVATLTNIIKSCLKDIVAKHEEEIAVLQEENACLRVEMNAQHKRIQELESYSRIDNLIISGLEESYASAAGSQTSTVNENAGTGSENSAESEAVFTRFCREKLNVDIKEADISICHRLKKGPKDRFRPMIVRFASRKVRQEVLAARKNLRNASSRIFINEHLTAYSSKLFQSTRQLWKTNKIAGTWTWNCKIFAKKLDGRIVHISSEQDLTQIS